MRRRLPGLFARARSEGRAALLVFLEAGDPDLDTSVRLCEGVSRAGADLIELGVPFSDPIADGPTIQRASERALRAGGGLRATLEVAASLRKRGVATPLLLFTYFNPVLAMGEVEFAHRASEVGIDAVLVTDLPPEEGRPLATLLKSARLDPIFLLAPTSTDDRVRRAAALSRGFVYLVSRAGVTGAREALPEGLPELVARVRRRVTRLPIAVGFGISTPEQVREAARLADGVVVGSALVAAIEAASAAGEDPVPAAESLVRALASATVR